MSHNQSLSTQLPLQQMLQKEVQIADISQANEIVQGGLFASIFPFFAKSNWRSLLQNSVAHLVVFPAAAATHLMDILLAIYDYSQAKNRHIGKLGNLLLKFITGSLAITAIIGSLVAATLFATLTPLLFVTAMALNMASNLSMTLGHGLHYLRAKRLNLVTTEIHQQKAKGYGVATLMSSILTVGMACLMLLKVPAILMTIAAWACAVTSCMGALFGVRAALAKRKEIQLAKENGKSLLVEDLNGTLEFTQANKIHPHALANALEEKSVADAAKKDFYYRANRIATLDDFLEKDRVFNPRAKKGFQASSPRSYLLTQITDKIEKLYAETKAGEVTWRERQQEAKRIAKLEVLHGLLALIATTKEIDNFCARLEKKGVFRDFFRYQFVVYPHTLCSQGITNLAGFIASQSYQKTFKLAFQSFFKATGDVQDIFEAAEAYFNDPNFNYISPLKLSALPLEDVFYPVRRHF